MSNFLAVTTFLLLAPIANAGSTYLPSLDKILATSPTANCVNEGGSCNGSLPCCGQDNFCIRGVCQNVPEKLALASSCQE